MIPFISAIVFTCLSAGEPEPMQRIRVAAFNIWELNGQKLAAVDQNGRGINPQLAGAAEIIQRVRPDILLVNEIDFDSAERKHAILFRERYLAVSQRGQAPVDYPYVFFEPVNSGVPTGKDLDNDGRINGPADAYGYGRYPGQYGTALFSRFEIDREKARTFRRLLWKDMPGNLMPDGKDGKPEWYGADEAALLRLSSKSHWDVPVRVGGGVLHLLCSHPTPPVFDGPEDRNGRRNFDEIRFWADYLSGGAQGAYIVDDQGSRGPLPPAACFVILGDLNADPSRDQAPYGQPAAEQLLKHPRVRDPAPTSRGALGNNQPGPPYFLDRKTCDFGRIDYLLPSAELTVSDAGVFWPARDDPLYRLVRRRESSSDHRLVWIEVLLPRALPAAGRQTQLNTP